MKLPKNRQANWKPSDRYMQDQYDPLAHGAIFYVDGQEYLLDTYIRKGRQEYWDLKTTFALDERFKNHPDGAAEDRFREVAAAHEMRNGYSTFTARMLIFENGTTCITEDCDTKFLVDGKKLNDLEKHADLKTAILFLATAWRGRIDAAYKAEAKRLAWSNIAFDAVRDLEGKRL